MHHLSSGHGKTASLFWWVNAGFKDSWREKPLVFLGLNGKKYHLSSQELVIVGALCRIRVGCMDSSSLLTISLSHSDKYTLVL